VDRTIRCETLAQAASADVGRLAEIMLDGSLGDVQLLTPPTVGMVMARAIDGAQSETFNLGEVLVSEARVSIAGCEGWGMVMGSDASHALAVAIVDAGLEAGHAASARIHSELARLAAGLERKHAADWQTVAPTRVSFETF
jgi:alpha-D-ribose 1-methylphosphonate 5-triphosphate synthase subunit PhnG